ncbi:MAG: hypothetical protein IH597_06470 [Bacteroidales bacterium]|nr:hypothetical protein [Bacteroidales bacterium]
MYEGIVRTIDHEEGIGYIQEMDDSRIMFMIDNVSGPLEEEDKVTYDIETKPTRQAVNVSRIGS